MLVDSENRACLADFGFSAIVEASNSSGSPGGTRAYMAPELANSGGLKLEKEPIDVFALGTVIHEVLPQTMNSGMRR